MHDSKKIFQSINTLVRIILLVFFLIVGLFVICTQGFQKKSIQLTHASGYTSYGKDVKEGTLVEDDLVELEDIYRVINTEEAYEKSDFGKYCLFIDCTTLRGDQILLMYTRDVDVSHFGEDERTQFTEETAEYIRSLRENGKVYGIVKTTFSKDVLAEQYGFGSRWYYDYNATAFYDSTAKRYLSIKQFDRTSKLEDKMIVEVDPYQDYNALEVETLGIKNKIVFRSNIGPFFLFLAILIGISLLYRNDTSKKTVQTDSVCKDTSQFTKSEDIRFLEPMEIS